MEVNDIVESKREKVQSLLPIVNLAALFVSQYVLDDFSHLINSHTLELNIQDRAKVDAFFAFFLFFFWLALLTLVGMLVVVAIFVDNSTC